MCNARTDKSVALINYDAQAAVHLPTTTTTDMSAFLLLLLLQIEIEEREK